MITRDDIVDRLADLSVYIAKFTASPTLLQYFRRYIEVMSPWKRAIQHIERDRESPRNLHWQLRDYVEGAAKAVAELSRTYSEAVYRLNSLTQSFGNHGSFRLLEKNLRSYRGPNGRFAEITHHATMDSDRKDRGDIREQEASTDNEESRRTLAVRDATMAVRSFMMSVASVFSNERMTLLPHLPLDSSKPISGPIPRSLIKSQPKFNSASSIVEGRHELSKLTGSQPTDLPRSRYPKQINTQKQTTSDSHQLSNRNKSNNEIKTMKATHRKNPEPAGSAPIREDLEKVRIKLGPSLQDEHKSSLDREINPINKVDAPIVRDALQIALELPKLLKASLSRVYSGGASDLPRSRPRFQAGKAVTSPKSLKPNLHTQIPFTSLHDFIVASKEAQSKYQPDVESAQTKRTTPVAPHALRTSEAQLNRQSKEIADEKLTNNLHLNPLTRAPTTRDVIARVTNTTKNLAPRLNAVDGLFPIIHRRELSSNSFITTKDGQQSPPRKGPLRPVNLPREHLRSLPSETVQDVQVTKPDYPNVSRYYPTYAKTPEFTGERYDAPLDFLRRMPSAYAMLSQAGRIISNSIGSLTSRLELEGHVNVKTSLKNTVGSAHRSQRKDPGQRSFNTDSPNRGANTRDNSTKPVENHMDAQRDRRLSVLTNPISSIQQKYTKYNFTKMMDLQQRNGIARPFTSVSNRSRSVLLSPPRPQVRKIARMLKPNDTQFERMRDGSIDLPLVSQLQTILTKHAFRRTENLSNTISTLNQNEARTSLLPTAIPMAFRKRDAIRSGVTTTDTNESRALPSHRLQEYPKLQKQKHTDDLRMIGDDRQKKTSEFSSQHALRKKIEQIFQEELRRYGL